MPDSFRIAKVLRAFRSARSPEDVFDAAVAHAIEIGFAHLSYMSLRLDDNGPRFIMTSAPAEWERDYRRHAGRSVDPIFAGAYQTSLPFLWAHEDFDDASRPVRALMDERASRGMSAGVVCPIRSHLGYGGILHYSCKAIRAVVEAHTLPLLPEMHWIAYHFGAAIVRTYPAAKLPLEGHVQHFLELTATGYTDREIGERTGYNPRTVKWTIDNLRHQLGAINRQHLVHIAHKQGLL